MAFGGLAIKPTFVAYVDESGDEGYQFVPRPARKSSEWFILSAVVCRTDAVADINLGVAGFNLCRETRSPFHFRRAGHEECVAFTMVSGLPVTAISIFAHKPSIRDGALKSKKHYLFDYCTKLLIERISWYCHAHRGGEQGLVRIIFSSRRQLKVDRIVTYLLHLQELTDFYCDSPAPREARNDVRWSVINLGLIDMQPHDSLPGLQVADAVVSGCAKAVEFSRYSTTEHRFVKTLHPTFYVHGLRCRSYGVKFFPDYPTLRDPAGVNRLHWLRRIP